MPRYENFAIEVNGRSYSGTWHVEGKEVCVSSAYDSGRAPLGRRRPEAVAADIMRKIVAGRR